jgi:prepilin-type N-terminal cleavage/methylation domain-containing protein
MRPRHGFTLIELLVVVLIVGLLAAIGVPKFASSKERAFLATMKADLRNLASAEESYLYDKGTYFSGAIPDPSLNFVPSTAVSITLSGVTPSGWQAIAQHSQTSKTCAVFYGTASPIGGAVDEGVAVCS